jgi:hypothetical protein
LLATCAAAPAAVADDQGVYDAWVSRDAGFAKAGKAFTQAMRPTHVRAAAAARALRKALRLSKAVTTAVNAQAPSSDAGTGAKAAVLDSMNLFRLSLVHKLRGVKALAHRHPRAADREFKRAVRLTKRSMQAQNTARQAFAQAGVQIKH